MNEPSSSDDRINGIIAVYLKALAAGQEPNRAALFAANPDLADELKSFFNDHDRMHKFVEPPTLGPNEPEAAAMGEVVRYFGDYVLLEELARGGMGVVYKARQISLNRPVALKMILAGQLASATDVQRFRAEAEAAANLDHPNIVPIYEVGEHQGQQYFSMKLVEGGSLAALLKTSTTDVPRLNPRKSVKSVVEILISVNRAVHYAHQRGILHRDLKPGNILLDTNNQPLVTDFGLAKCVEGDSKQTQTGAILGTPSYMAPEQARAEKQLTIAADVYSLGAILYECLIGRPPFQATTTIEIVMQVLEKEPTRPSALNPQVDRDLETIALKCLEKDPARRYESAATLADELDRWQRGEPIEARPVSTTERARRWCRRNPVVAALIASLAFALLVGTIVSTLFAAAAGHRAEEAQRSEADAIVARQRADMLAIQANDETARAKFARAEAEQTLYFNRVALAQQYWRANNVLQADVILQNCSAEMRGWEWSYLNHLCHAELFVIPASGPSGGPSLHFSENVKRVAAVSIDGNTHAEIWDLSVVPPKLLSQVIRGAGTFYCAGTLSADGTMLGRCEKECPRLRLSSGRRPWRRRSSGSSCASSRRARRRRGRSRSVVPAMPSRLPRGKCEPNAEPIISLKFP